MARTIEEVLDEIKENYNRHWDWELDKQFVDNEEMENLLDEILKIHKAEQRSKGHWIEHPHEWGDNWQYSRYECSNCHTWAYFDSDFCPDCGADMREVEK